MAALAGVVFSAALLEGKDILLDDLENVITSPTPKAGCWSQDTGVTISTETSYQGRQSLRYESAEAVLGGAYIGFSRSVMKDWNRYGKLKVRVRCTDPNHGTVLIQLVAYKETNEYAGALTHVLLAAGETTLGWKEVEWDISRFDLTRMDTLSFYSYDREGGAFKWRKKQKLIMFIDDIRLAEPDPDDVRGATFEDVTEQLGLKKIGDAHASWADYDNDGYVDLSVVNPLYHNNKGKEFTGVNFNYHKSVWGDYNNDGALDFFSYYEREVREHDGTPLFTKVSLPAELREGNTRMDDTRGASWADYNGDGYIDLYLGGALHPNSGRVSPDALLFNDGDGTFTYASGWSGPTTYARGVTSCDFDEDGDQDIYVSNYWLQANLLWLNRGPDNSRDMGSFTNVAAAYNATGGNGHSVGSAWGDLDNDGHFDLFAGNFSHPGQPQSRFLKNLGPFDEAQDRPGGSYRFEDKGQCGLAWQESYASPALGDYDNDGDLDLYFTTIYPGDHCVLYRNDGNWKFTDVTAAENLGGLGTTYQAAWADFDNDGDLDLVSDGKLLRNSGNSNHWLAVRLQGDGKSVNRAAIGAQARIRLDGRTLTRQVEGGTGEANQNELKLHFGLGGIGDPVDVVVTWPNGTTQKMTTAVDRSVVIKMQNPSLAIDDLEAKRLVGWTTASMVSRDGANRDAAEPLCSISLNTDPEFVKQGEHSMKLTCWAIDPKNEINGYVLVYKHLPRAPVATTDVLSMWVYNGQADSRGSISVNLLIDGGRRVSAGIPVDFKGWKRFTFGPADWTGKEKWDDLWTNLTLAQFICNGNFTVYLDDLKFVAAASE